MSRKRNRTPSKTLCTVTGCNTPINGRGWCNKHYLRWQKYGSTELPRKPSAQERFMAMVEQNENTCWIWTGADNGVGYGLFGEDGKLHLASRWIYQRLVGPIPQGLFLCHNCPGEDNPRCVNPAHMFLGTQADNMRDASNKARLQRGEERYNATLTDELVREIRSSSESAKSLAKRMGVSEKRIYRVRSGEIWKHVEDRKGGDQ